MIAYQSMLQSAGVADLRGRVFALYDVLWNAARLLSLGLGGLLAGTVGVRAVYAVGGVLLLTAFGVGWWGGPDRGRAGDRYGTAG